MDIEIIDLSAVHPKKLLIILFSPISVIADGSGTVGIVEELPSELWTLNILNCVKLFYTFHLIEKLIYSFIKVNSQLRLWHHICS